MPARPSSKDKITTKVKRCKMQKEKWKEVAVLSMQQRREGKHCCVWAALLYVGCISSIEDKVEFCTKWLFVRKKTQVGRSQDLPEPEVYNIKYKAIVPTWQRTQCVAITNTNRLRKQQLFDVIITVNPLILCVTEMHGCLTLHPAVQIVTITLRTLNNEHDTSINHRVTWWK